MIIRRNAIYTSLQIYSFSFQGKHLSMKLRKKTKKLKICLQRSRNKKTKPKKTKSVLDQSLRRPPKIRRHVRYVALTYLTFFGASQTLVSLCNWLRAKAESRVWFSRLMQSQLQVQRNFCSLIEGRSYSLFFSMLVRIWFFCCFFQGNFKPSPDSIDDKVTPSESLQETTNAVFGEPQIPSDSNKVTTPAAKESQQEVYMDH